MARLARMVIPGVSHHVAQRGNCRERKFFEAGDEQVYLDLMSAQLRRHAVESWAYCLMPNHVHSLETADGFVVKLRNSCRARQTELPWRHANPSNSG